MKDISYNVWGKGIHEPKDSWFYIGKFLNINSAKKFISKRNNKGETFRITKETVEEIYKE